MKFKKSTNHSKYTTNIFGDKFWYVNGKLHREDGSAIERHNGSREWWLNEKRHRANGPAIEDASGTKIWYKEGLLHREDGPAVESSNGNKWWFLDNKHYTEKKYWEEIARRKNKS